MVGHQGNANAGRDLQALTVEKHRLGEQLAQGVGGGAHVLGDVIERALKAGEQHHEFVAAQSRDGVFDAHAGLQACRDDFQHRIAHRMAQRIVDVLEVVKVQKQQGAAQVLPGEQGTLLAQAVHEQGAVGQVGQRVVVGQVADLRLGGFKLADVAGREQQARSAIEGNGLNRDLNVKQVAAPRASQHFAVADTALGLQLIQQPLTLGAVAPNPQLVGAAAHHLGAGVAREAGETVVDLQITAGGVIADGDCIRA